MLKQVIFVGFSLGLGGGLSLFLDRKDRKERKEAQRIEGEVQLILNEYMERENSGSAIKCPNCLNGWAFILDGENADSSLVCFYRGPSHASVEVEKGGYKDRFTGQPITPGKLRRDRDRDPLNNIEFANDSGGTAVKSRFSEIAGYSFSWKLKWHTSSKMTPDGSGYCGNLFTHRKSLAMHEENAQRERENEREMANRLRRLAQEEAQKSPEQKELEKLNKEVEGLRKDLQRQEELNRRRPRRIFP